MKSAIAFALLTATAVAQDPCHVAHTDQASCDADKKTGGGCTWCKCAAVPSACFTLTDSKKLPPGVYECDSALEEVVTAPPSTPTVFKTWSSPVLSTCTGTGCSGSSSKGTMAYSESQNASTWRPAKNGGQGVPTVVDFNAGAAFFLYGNDGTCNFQCPLDSQSTSCNEQTDANLFCEYGYVHNSKYVDSNGDTDHYHMNSGIGPIVMAQFDYFMDSKTHYPVETNVMFQPFGKFIGNITTHYENFSTSEPDASLFAVPNMNNCQQGSEAQCDQISAKTAIHAGMMMKRK